MGDTQRRYTPRIPEDDVNIRGRVDARPQDIIGQALAISSGGRFLSKYPPFHEGDRFGELTIVRLVYGPMGGVKEVHVRCTCGAPAYVVDAHNLRKGASSRCAPCGRKQTKKVIKGWYKYESIVPDVGHRRRFCNRIAAANNRCYSPHDAGFPNYGGRGITVHAPWREDRSLFLAHLITLEGWDNPVLEMDRIDVNRGYEPGNLRFITKRENILNKRSVVTMQKRILELEARLRHCKCGAE